MGASAFKATCLAVLDRVRDRGETVTITKRGRVIARLVPAADDDEEPRRKLRGAARWKGDPFEPVVGESEIQALK
jgi:prevent-host-death family protein